MATRTPDEHVILWRSFDGPQLGDGSVVPGFGRKPKAIGIEDALACYV